MHYDKSAPPPQGCDSIGLLNILGGKEVNRKKNWLRTKIRITTTKPLAGFNYENFQNKLKGLQLLQIFLPVVQKGLKEG